jgi:CubicO group peptidase (beta-lactamase class C family)
MKLTDQVHHSLNELVDNAVSGQDTIPGATVIIIAKDGSDLFAKAAGKLGLSAEEPMTLDSVFSMASCTKLITSLAVMQLVEKGVLELDNAEQAEGFCPEWHDLRVLTASGELKARKNKITLRMLLTQTAGFGYNFFNEGLRDYEIQAGLHKQNLDISDIIRPLLFEPGERWEYGVRKTSENLRVAGC